MTFPPCPFCGGAVIRDFQPFERKGWRIDCNDCNGGVDAVSRDIAVEKWNRRPIDNDSAKS